MRVLFVTGAFPPMKCGVGDYTAQLVAHLAHRSGMVPGVVTSSAATECPEPPDHFYPVVKRWNCTAIKKLMETVQRFRPDIVHLQYPSSFGRVFLPNFLPLILAMWNIPVVQTWHEHPIYSQFINAVTADALVVVDPAYPSAYSLLYRRAVRHILCQYIPIGSNIPRVEPSAECLSSLRCRFNAEKARLLVYFGFAQPFKGVDLLFKVADPQRDRLVLVCDLDARDSYHAALLREAASPEWIGRCSVTGFVPAVEVAEILASADAAIFPFSEGVTPRNGSVLAARLQGTLVVTTHPERRGYDNAEHTYYAAPGDVTDMKAAIDSLAGIRYSGVSSGASWDDICGMHHDLYERVISAVSGDR